MGTEPVDRDRPDDLVVGEMRTGKVVRKGIYNCRTGVFHTTTGDERADAQVWRNAKGET